METTMNEMNENIIQLKQDVELIKNILVSEGEIKKEIKTEIEEARDRVREGEVYTEEEAKEILNLSNV